MAPVMTVMGSCYKDLLTCTCSFAVELDRPLAAGVAQCMTLASIVPSQMSGEGGESCIGVEVWMLRAE